MLSVEQDVLRLVLAGVLGGLVGWERERLDRAAGLRTHALVALASALVLIVSMDGFHDIVGASGVNLDPSRVAAQVVSGVGFLGAGTIILRRDAVRGLTTAASVWAVAAVGLAVGGGLYVPATVTTALALVILVGLKPLERRVFTHRREPVVTLVGARGAISLRALERVVEESGFRLEQLVVQGGEVPGEDRIDLHLAGGRPGGMAAAGDQLRRLDGVRGVVLRRGETPPSDGQAAG